MAKHDDHRPGAHGETHCCGSGCPPTQRGRNHYFTGKLLVERDFNDEQDYFLGKHRRHARHLHGWGTACGLTVHQHPHEDCRDRLVVVEPGLAIDCCGREILVECEESFDFRQAFLDAWRAANPEGDEPTAEEEHDFQICIRHRECPAEEVPVLFDECSEPDACEPNRIYDGYELEVILDPELQIPGPEGRGLDWECSLHLARAVAVASHGDSDRLWVLTGPAAATLYAVTGDLRQVVGSWSLGDATGLDLAVSADGARLFVALQPTTAGADPVIRVLDATAPGSAPLDELTVTGAAGGRLRLAAAADGRLLAIDENGERLILWTADLSTSTDIALPPPVDLALSPPSSPDGPFAYILCRGTASDPASLRVIDLTTDTETDSLDLEGDTEPVALAVAGTDDGNRLALAGTANGGTEGHLGVIVHRPSAAPALSALAEPFADLAHPPVDLALSPGGRWVYLLEREPADGRGYLQAVDAHRLETGHAHPESAARFVGEEPRRVEIDQAGGRLLVAFEGDPTVDTAGGVAVVDTFAERCEDLFDRVLDPCTTCEEGGECVVLATVEDYHWGDPVVDPPAHEDEEEDGEDGGEEDEEDENPVIDNRLGRRLLPSTGLLAEIIQCLLEHRTQGEPGEQGPPGIPGQPGENGEHGEDGEDGAGIDQVEVECVPCGEDPTAELSEPAEDELRVLTLTLPSCCCEPVTRICAINWKHLGNHPPGDLELAPLGIPPSNFFRPEGLVVAFDGPVRAQDITPFSCRLFTAGDRETPRTLDWQQVLALTHPAVLELEEVAGDFGPRCEIRAIRDVLFEPRPDDQVNGVVFLHQTFGEQSTDFGLFNKVEIQGDFIRDAEGRALDAEHLPPWLPARATGDHMAGGLFESYFTRLPRQTPGVDVHGFHNFTATGEEAVINVNFADVDELSRIPGVNRDVAEAIVARRREVGRFRTLEELDAVHGVGRATLETLRNTVTVEDTPRSALERLRSLLGGGES